VREYLNQDIVTRMQQGQSLLWVKGDRSGGEHWVALELLNRHTLMSGPCQNVSSD
jgi:hypothetical protein